jgi:hypothetical protein
MTPERLEALAMSVRTLSPNAPEHAGLIAWHPVRSYLFGPGNQYAVHPIHAENRHNWVVSSVATGKELYRSATFAEAVAGQL